jgi:hypothetical protein
VWLVAETWSESARSRRRTHVSPTRGRVHSIQRVSVRSANSWGTRYGGLVRSPDHSPSIALHVAVGIVLVGTAPVPTQRTEPSRQAEAQRPPAGGRRGVGHLTCASAPPNRRGRDDGTTRGATSSSAGRSWRPGAFHRVQGLPPTPRSLRQLGQELEAVVVGRGPQQRELDRRDEHRRRRVAGERRGRPPDADAADDVDRDATGTSPRAGSTWSQATRCPAGANQVTRRSDQRTVSRTSSARRARRTAGDLDRTVRRDLPPASRPDAATLAIVDPAAPSHLAGPRDRERLPVRDAQHPARASRPARR